MSHALIIDADYLVFKSLSAAEKETEWSDGVWTLECDHEQAWDKLLAEIRSIVEKKKAWAKSKIVMCFTDSVNWRKEVLPSYKANRKATRKPVGFHAFVERVMNHDGWTSFIRPTLEGDDCMGIIGTKPSIVGAKKCTLVSCDKDFNTIPCEFFWLTTGEIKQIDTEQANYWHMKQTMMGDITDGYGGITGIGETSAVKFLDEPVLWTQETKVMKSGKRKGEEVTHWVSNEPTTETLWECMVSLANKQGMTEEELLVQARVARICRASDYNFKTKEVILWNPIRKLGE